MEILGIVALVIGIVAGLIAVADKLGAAMPRKVRNKKRFKVLHQQWADTGHHSLPKHDEFRGVLGAALATKLSDDEKAFALMCALQHGDQSMHDLIRANVTSSTAATRIVGALAGRGIRVGWRAEYALSQLAPDRVHPLVTALLESPSTSEAVREAAKRVLAGSTVAHLRELSDGQDAKLRSYANEVLTQVGSDIQAARMETGH